MITGEHLCTIVAHEQRVRKLTQLREGTLVSTVEGDIRFWCPKTGMRKATVEHGEDTHVYHFRAFRWKDGIGQCSRITDLERVDI
jgi:hypothetical protein